MRPVPAILLSALVLQGCAAIGSAMGPPLYEPQSYLRLDWTKKGFGEARAKCRYDEMGRNKIRLLDQYRVDPTYFKSCMERYGYHYMGPTGLLGASGAYQERLF